MKITAIETMRADAGWRIFSFLKVTTSDGIIGWSEFNESFGSAGLGQVIEALAPTVIGRDPMRIELINAHLDTLTVQSRGGLNRQAIGAIENALLDIKGKALGVPVYQLFGGAVRDRIPIYFSHCGSYRTRNAHIIGKPALRSYDDLARMGEEVKAGGFKALKTNVMLNDGEKLVSYRPGFGHDAGFPALNTSNRVIRAAVSCVKAFREACGPDMEIMLDLNFNYKTEGYHQIAQAVGPYGLSWLEMDIHDAGALANVKQRSPVPVASCETLLERRDFKPFFEQYAMDVAIIDVIWNGYMESLKIASMADVYKINVAPHNFYGHLATMMSAHFSAAVPNLRIMETDIDAVPWRDELVTASPVIEQGELVLPTAPGWGIDVNEAGVRARPPKG